VILIISLVVFTPLVSADNFLTGFSFFEDAGNFFGNIFDAIKGVFSKETIDGRVGEGGGSAPRSTCDSISGSCRLRCLQREEVAQGYSCPGRGRAIAEVIGSNVCCISRGECRLGQNECVGDNSYRTCELNRRWSEPISCLGELCRDGRCGDIR